MTTKGNSTRRDRGSVRTGLGARKAARAAELRVELQAAIDADLARPLISRELVSDVERAEIASRVRAQNRSSTGIGSIRSKTRHAVNKLSIWEIVT